MPDDVPEGGYLQGYEINFKNLQNVPGLKEKVKGVLGIPGWADVTLSQLVDLWRGRLGEPGAPEEPPLPAELLSLDPSDPRHMAQLLLDQILAEP